MWYTEQAGDGGEAVVLCIKEISFVCCFYFFTVPASFHCSGTKERTERKSEDVEGRTSVASGTRQLRRRGCQSHGQKEGKVFADPPTLSLFYLT